MSGDTDRPNSTPPPVDRLSLIWRRVHDHKVVQWSVAYIALAYAFQHGIILVSESLDWPHAVPRVFLLLLVLGLPLVITFAWYQGARASRNFSQAELSILTALLVVGSLVFYVFVRPESQAHSPVAQEASVTAARQAAASPKGAISVAVLPFLNLSSDKDQEFFSDGMTEEITAALAKVPDLRVVARTSAFEFKGKNVEIGKIGEQLHATHLIEGSVRKAGNRVRITAQLIKSDDGTHVWAEDYDRDLTDIFAVQEDIARAITASLHMTLGLKPGEQLISQRVNDAKLHEDYLRARSFVRDRTPPAVRRAIDLLNDVIARDPNYAPAWAMLAYAHHIEILGNPVGRAGAIAESRSMVQDTLTKEKAAAQRAVNLDRGSPDSYLALAYSADDSGDFIGAVEGMQHVLMLDPDNADALQSYSIRLAELGFTTEAVSIREHLTAIEPFVPAFQNVTARILLAAGDAKGAIEVIKARPTANLAELYAADGRFSEAADTLARLTSEQARSGASVLANAIRLLRLAPGKAPVNDRPELGNLDWVYVYVGAPERFAQMYALELEANVHNGLNHGKQFAPAYTSMRKTEAFKHYVRDSGMLAYWRAKGWPPQCHPTTGDDFECT